ncbi:hypothetical protein D3C76_1802330 [compost metagenome]
MIVIVDVFHQSGMKFVQITEFGQVKKFGLQRAEEAFHRSIVVTVSFSRHAGCDRVFFEKPAINRHPILPALV